MNTNLRTSFIASAKRSHLAAQAYLTGIVNPEVPTYETGGDLQFARRMAQACMNNAQSARRMAAAVARAVRAERYEGEDLPALLRVQAE